MTRPVVWILWLGCVFVTASVASERPSVDRRESRTRGPLQEVLDRVRELRKERRSPVVVFDLDDTLVRVAGRTKRILVDWAAHLPARHDEIRRSIGALDPETMPWDPKKSLDTAGVTDLLLRRSAMRQWNLFFFSNRYLREDFPTPGALEFLDALKEMKSRIVYLTGRDKVRMGLGTKDQLHVLGFPEPCSTVKLMLKPDAKAKDHTFKEEACAEIGRFGTFVAGFDNEPGNVNIFAKFFPGSIVVHVDTVYSPDAPPLDRQIRQIRDFRRPW
jgi:hypothetical protein